MTAVAEVHRTPELPRVLKSGEFRWLGTPGPNGPTQEEILAQRKEWFRERVECARLLRSIETGFRHESSIDWQHQDGRLICEATYRLTGEVFVATPEQQEWAGQMEATTRPGTLGGGPRLLVPAG